MDPLIGASLIGGVGNMLGGLFQGSQQASAADRTNAFNAQQAEINRNWQTDMSNSAYQRSKRDLELAGYNPMLAVSQGGASSGGGSAASGVMPDVPDSIGRGITSALETRRLAKELKAVDSQANLNTASEAAARAQEQLTQSNAKKTELETKVIESQMPAIQERSKFDAEKNALDRKLLYLDATTKRVTDALGIPAGMFKNLLKGKSKSPIKRPIGIN